MIWQNPLYVEERASDLAEFPVPVIWQNCLCQRIGKSVFGRIECMWRSVPVIWHNFLYVDSVPVISD